MSTKTVVTAAAALISMLAVTAGSANAGGRHFHGFHRHHHHHGLHLRIGPVYRDCSFYREMWEDTGSFKWKRRYYQCKGWW